MISARVAPPPAQPSRGGGQAARGGDKAIRGGDQPIRGRPRDGGQSGEAQPLFYAFPARPEVESSNAVITCIILVYHRYASVLFEPGSTYSYVSSYFALYLNMSRDSLSATIYVSTPVWDFIVVDRVYHACLVTIRSNETRVDLLLLDMVDFDVILSMDWLSPYHTILDSHAKIVTLAMSGLPLLEWRGTHDHSPSVVEKECLVYLAYIRDPGAEVPYMDLVLVVYKFPNVFPSDLSGMPLDRDIDFVSGTQTNSTAPYRMAPVELKKLKEQLQDYFDKGFIRLSVSPWHGVDV
ncbi:uncharacterized protein [Nicotiana tomentosiformis]|uniref:uncharacterized protein n=1 Tax=Nicotiana tomentosiformis TaxID=4098 RepID=UPI00388C3E8E